MKTKKNKESKDDLTAGDRLGIKGLNKGKRRKLEAYQHLFYLLQVIQKCFISTFIFPSLKASIKYPSSVADSHLMLLLFSSLLFRPIHPTWQSWSSRCLKTSPLSLWTLWSSLCTTTLLTREKNTSCSNSLRRLWRRKSSETCSPNQYWPQS